MRNVIYLVIGIVVFVVTIHFLHTIYKKGREEYAPEKVKTDSVRIIHDTVVSGVLESGLQKLLINYYKAGWMDASNELSDLYNEGRLNNVEVEKKRQAFWRKIEKEVTTKK